MKQKARITVGFDAKRVVRNETGLGNYSRYVIEALAEFAPEARLLLSAAEPGKVDIYQDLLRYPNVELLLPPKSAWSNLPYYKAFWRNRGCLPQLRGRGMDIFHGLSNELPSDADTLDVPTVLTVHDLVFERYPSLYSKMDVKFHQHTHSRSLQDATHIIAVSENTKNDLIELYDVPEEQVSVIYQGCSNIFRQTLSPYQIYKVVGEYLLPPEYILTVGTVDSRKNAGLAVRALRRLKNKTIPLVIVGRKTPYVREVKKLAREYGVSHRLIFIEGVPNQDLPALYQGSSLFVFPSLYEGFGLPIVEALCCNIPVIAATGSGMEEAGGPGSLYCDPFDFDELGDMMNEVLENPSLRKRMVVEGNEWSSRFLPSTMADELMDLYESLL